MKRVAVVGSGPCGLAALKEMCDAGFEAMLFERSERMGGVFASAAAYPDLHLTISNWCMAFSDFPDPMRLCYPSAGEYLQYLHNYASHFDLERHIQYNSEVISAQQGKDGQWHLQVRQGVKPDQTILHVQVDALVVSTGAHHVPRSPPAGLAGFTGRVIHSNEYGEEFKREVEEKKLRVLIVGGGESSADLSAEMGALSPEVAVWLRRPHCFGPRYLNKKNEMEQVVVNKTRDFPANSFLEAATTNRMSAAQNVYLYGLWRKVLWSLPILNGSLNSMCLESTKPAFFLNDQATFVTKNQRMCEAVGEGKVEVIVSKDVSSRGLTFDFRTEKGNGVQRREFDAVILCNGYLTEFPWLKVEGVSWNPRDWFLHTFPAGLGHTLSFVGYARPHQGGIPPMAEMQARYVARIIRGDRVLPSNYATLARHDAVAERNYYHISPNLDTLVDYAAYLENVARRAGCEPRLPASSILLYNLHMVAFVAMIASLFGMEDSTGYMKYALPVWIGTLLAFTVVDDGLLIQWWLYPQWPVWYRQRGHGANPAHLRGILKRVPLWRSTAVTPGFLLLLFWSIPTFYLQRLIAPLLLVPHLLFTALGIRFREAWGGLLRPKMVVLHSGVWRLSDLFLP
ncbi:FAD/NAD(P)-binding domain-containing protein [Thozetella sp. PMI_491]|nr:FAD/NAD(P)-binding domain-containing protein [Thozetella sp. PMI_491]